MQLIHTRKKYFSQRVVFACHKKRRRRKWLCGILLNTSRAMVEGEGVETVYYVVEANGAFTTVAGPRVVFRTLGGLFCAPSQYPTVWCYQDGTPAVMSREWHESNPTKVLKFARLTIRKDRAEAVDPFVRPECIPTIMWHHGKPTMLPYNRLEEVVVVPRKMDIDRSLEAADQRTHYLVLNKKKDAVQEMWKSTFTRQGRNVDKEGTQKKNRNLTRVKFFREYDVPPEHEHRTPIFVVRQYILEMHASLSRRNLSGGITTDFALYMLGKRNRSLIDNDSQEEFTFTEDVPLLGGTATVVFKRQRL